MKKEFLYMIIEDERNNDAYKRTIENYKQEGLNNGNINGQRII